MSRKAARQQVGVALFPFLAVLICTMGALIVLLVLLVQQARVDASTIAARQVGASAADSKELRERLEDAQWQREVLEKSRTEKTDELAQSRAKLAHVEEHTQRLEAQARALLDRARSIDEGRKLRDEDLAAARAEAARLKAEVERKKKELDEARKKSRDGQEWYALIPYNGPSGTRRRPIYVECTEFGVIVQPEGLLLGAQDFSGPLGPGNPLDMALRATREHIERTAGDKAGQPYPLLVVRPSGVVAFGAAKAAIKAWDDEWGYELISDEKQIDFGPGDPALSATLSKTVAVARQRQAAMVAMMPRKFQGEEPLTSFSAEQVVQESAQQRSVRGNSGGLGSGTGSGGGGIGGSGYGGGTGMYGGSGAGGGAGPGQGAAGSFGGSSGAVAGSAGSGNGAAGRNGGDAFPNSPLNGGGVGGSGTGGGNGQAGGGPSLGSASGQSLAGGGVGQSTASGGNGASGPSGGTSSSRGGGSSSMSAGGPQSGSTSGGSSSTMPGQMGGGGPSLNFDLGGAKKTASSGTAGSPSGSSSGNASRSTANRGKNWALQGAQPHQIGVTRPIRISVQPDRIVMLPERGDNRAAQVVKIAPELNPDDVNRFVGAVQGEVKGWGLAVADGYWKPVLQAEVAPGAERHFMNLETALRGSGIEVMRR